MDDDDLIMGDDYGDPEESYEESPTPSVSEPSSKDINTVPLISDNDLRSGIKVLISDATGAIKRASISDIIALIAGRNAGGHNSFYRGEQIGTSVTNAQWSAIYNGTFDDMFIGDYWLINNIKWRIAAFDYWFNIGQNSSTGIYRNHHIVIVPDISLAQGKINSTRTTANSYIGSDFYTGNNSNTAKATAIAAVNSAFGASHILSHKEMLPSTTDGNYVISGAVCDSTVELMTECMVYGCRIYGSEKKYGDNSGSPKSGLSSFDYSQLPLFALNREHISLTEHYWLRDMAGSENWSLVLHGGLCLAGYPENANGIRPAFGIYSSTDPLAS